MTTTPEPKFLCDAEIIRELNLPEKVGRRMIRELDKRKPGRRPFPRKVPIAGDRRWWPDVVKYFDDPAALNVQGEK